MRRQTVSKFSGSSVEELFPVEFEIAALEQIEAYLHKTFAVDLNTNINVYCKVVSSHLLKLVLVA